jgi:hypothetical protein
MTPTVSYESEPSWGGNDTTSHYARGKSDGLGSGEEGLGDSKHNLSIIKKLGVPGAIALAPSPISSRHEFLNFANDCSEYFPIFGVFIS